MNKKLVIVMKFIFFILCMGLIVDGQRNIGLQGLLIMLVGLSGLLGLLFMYNQKHQ